MSVYRLYNKNEPSIFYIGSCKDMRKRKNNHKADCKKRKKI